MKCWRRLTPRSRAYLSLRRRTQPNHHMMGNTMTAARRRRKLHPTGRKWAWHGTGASIGRTPGSCAACRAGGRPRPCRADRGRDHRAGRGRPLQRARDQRLRSGRLFHRRARRCPEKASSNRCLPARYGVSGASGNRAAFAANPDIYMPRFGGYDPLGVARGVAVAGNPHAVDHPSANGSISSIRPRRATSSPATATGPLQPQIENGHGSSQTCALIGNSLRKAGTGDPCARRAAAATMRSRRALIRVRVLAGRLAAVYQGAPAHPR